MDRRTLRMTWVRRVLEAFGTMWLLVTLCFLMLSWAPGDPAGFDDPRLTPEAKAAQRRALGLEGSISQRYTDYLGHVVRGDLGLSVQHARPVSQLIVAALPASLMLGGGAVVIAFTLGLALATLAVRPKHSVVRWWVTRGLPALDSLPGFWLGLMAILVFSGWLGWLPSGGIDRPGGGDLLDRLQHWLLPALCLAIPGSAMIARHHLAALQRELQAPAARAAAALGISPLRILWRATRAALHPAITLFGLSLPTLVGGTAVIEHLFSWPGLGRLQVTALLSRDLPLALGALLLLATAVIAGGVISDGLSRWIDPRWRHVAPE